MKRFLAIDIGATSGRHIVGSADGGQITVREVYRFDNGVERKNGHLVWNIDALTHHVLEGIKAAFAVFPDIRSLAIDTWGVDYVLMRGDEEILPCYSYRDHRTASIIPEVHKNVKFEALYARTGIQFQAFNTVYQLCDDLNLGRLDDATDFLMMPEYLSYKLTGIKTHEYTNATTTGLVNGQTREYDKKVIARLGLPQRLFCDLKMPGARVGKLLPDVAEYVGGNCEVVLCASHDTASAVEGIDMGGKNEMYLSSGTWSLLGVKTPDMISDERSQKSNYSNEGGVGYVRYQKNIMGMWVVNRLRDELCPDMAWDEITSWARTSEFTEHININADIFLSPECMKQAFDTALGRELYSPWDYFNCAYYSLAHSYKKAIAELNRNTGAVHRELYIVGGGAKNKYLNELTEKICKVKVTALPIEATAIGNIKIQSKREAEK